MRRPALRVVALLSLLLGGQGAGAQPVAPGAPRAIEAREAWTFASPGLVGTREVYLTLVATGAADRLVGASSPVSAIVYLRGVAREQGLEIVPGYPLVLTPGDPHGLILIDRDPLRPGDSFPVILEFRTHGPVTVTVRVLSSEPKPETRRR